MATAQDLINRAFRIATVIHSGEAPGAAEIQDALTMLNQMLHGWKLDGIDLNHITLALTDTFPHPEDHEEAVVYNLVPRLCTEYGVTLKTEVATLATRLFVNLQNFYADPQDARIDPALDPYYSPNRYYDL